MGHADSEQLADPIANPAGGPAVRSAASRSTRPDRTASQTAKQPADQTEPARIMRLLAPLAGAYTRRASVDSQLLGANGQALAESGQQLSVCRVAGIATFDNKGRVRLRSIVSMTLHGMSMRVDDDMIQIHIDQGGGAELDERGRLSIPQSMLEAAGLSGGSRVAVIELDGVTIGLTAVDRLGLRRRVDAA